MDELLTQLQINGWKDYSLLEQAFIHRSYINENPKTKLHHNERLEFLGDAVLELVVTRFLYEKYPGKNEGDLTAYRSALVNTVTIGNLAKEMLFEEHLKLSKGEAKDTSKARISILADTFEAFLGAYYLDQGYAPVDAFLRRVLLPKTEDIVRNGLHKDPKSYVQEKSQELYGVTPSYKLKSEYGPDHDKRFEVAMYIGQSEISTGEGKSKQEAEVSAAKNALQIKGWA